MIICVYKLACIGQRALSSCAQLINRNFVRNLMRAVRAAVLLCGYMKHLRASL
jgi:hypothetical protein